MVLISKEFFYQHSHGVNLCELVHKDYDSCLKYHYSNFFNASHYAGIFKFMGPIFVLQTVFTLNSLRRSQGKKLKKLKKLFKSCLRSTLYAITFAQSLRVSMCLFYKIFGYVNYWCISFGPGIIGSSAIILESLKYRKLNTLLFVNMVIETLYRGLQYFKVINFTKFQKTGIFMLNSGFIMYLSSLIKRDISPSFWFYFPKVNKPNDPNRCIHNNGTSTESCISSSFNSAAKYFVLGYVVDVVKSSLKTMGKLFKNPKHIFNLLFRKTGVTFGLFFASFVGLYELLTCYLSNYQQKHFGSTIPLIAGFLSGSTFLIKPDMNILVFSTTTLLQVIYFKFNTILGKLNNLPWQVILFVLSNGFLMHCSIYAREICPFYYKTMLNIASNGEFFQIFNDITAPFPEVFRG